MDKKKVYKTGYDSGNLCSTYKLQIIVCDIHQVFIKTNENCAELKNKQTDELKIIPSKLYLDQGLYLLLVC